MKRPLSYIPKLALIAGLAALIAGLAYLSYRNYHDYRVWSRGRVTSFKSPIPALHTPRYGVNIALEQYQDEKTMRQALAYVREAGFGVVRQHFPWADIEPQPGVYRWEIWDIIIKLCAEYDLQVIAVLDTSPAWARKNSETGNRWAPPAQFSTFAAFSGALAARYEGRVLAYQIWDQPNIAPHWGSGEVNPREYVELLRQASAVIRTTDPQALIIAGGMAPTVEQGGRNLSDIQFLREINRRGAGTYYDIMGIRALGFWSGPTDRRVSEEVLNFSRVILIREEMERRGLGDKAIWALELGWCALPTGWSGDDSPSGNDSEAVQNQRLLLALSRIEQEWPWLGLVHIQHLQPNADLGDPIWGYSLLLPSGTPREVFALVRQKLAGAQIVPPGYLLNPQPFFTAEPDGRFSLTFYGSALQLELDAGTAAGAIGIRIDDGETRQFSLSQKGITRVLAARNLAPGQHTMTVLAEPAQLDAIIGMRVLALPDSLPLVLQTIAGVAGIILLVAILLKVGKAIPWRGLWSLALARTGTVPGWLILVPMALLLASAALVPNPVLRLVLLVLYGLLSLLRPRQALWVAIFCIPLAPIQMQLGPGRFSLTEISLLSAVAAFCWQILLVPGNCTKIKAPVALRRISLLDIGVALLIVLGAASCALAEYQRVAWREYRVVVFESALFYILIRLQTWEPSELVSIQRVLVASAACVALYALITYLTPGGVVQVEGVRRARAFYGSPNNLALYLERVLPAAAAFAISQKRCRRWLAYGVVLSILVAIILTFSRGSLLLGLPAAAMVMAFAILKRRRWLIAAAVMVFVMLLLPVIGTERFSSLLDPTRGTTFIRLGLWRASWLMVRDHPLLGVGLDNFLYYYPDYIQPGAEVERFLSHPHNIALDFWLRLGAGGLLILAVFSAGIIRRTWLLLSHEPNSGLQLLRIASLAGLAAMAAHGLIDSSFFVIELAHWFMVTAAWLQAAEAISTQAASLTITDTASILGS